MNFGKLAWILGAALTVGVGGMSATACSSSSSGNTGTGSGSGSGGGSMDSGLGADTATGDDGSSTTGDTGTPPGDDGGAGVDCGKIPSLHPETNAGDVYCGFGADGGNLTCSKGTMCCLGGGTAPNYAPQECAPWMADGTGCTNPGEDAGKASAEGFACNQVADCTANGMTGAVACCITGGAKGPTPQVGCGYAKVSNGTGTICESTGGAEGGASTTGACQPGEIQACQADVDCPSGQKCQLGKYKIFQLGYCM